MISDYDALLKVIDARMLETPPRQIPYLLRNLPLAVWGELLLNIPPEYSRLKARFPSMPPDIVQDMIYAYSVFTHLSEKTVRAAFDTLRGYIVRDGVLLITIRPKEYWRMNPEAGVDAGAMMATHEQSGFAFAPHHRIAIDGDITYGDTSISIDYIRAYFPRWQIVSEHHDPADPFQILLFLRPA